MSAPLKLFTRDGDEKRYRFRIRDNDSNAYLNPIGASLAWYDDAGRELLRISEQDNQLTISGSSIEASLLPSQMAQIPVESHVELDVRLTGWAGPVTIGSGLFIRVNEGQPDPRGYLGAGQPTLGLVLYEILADIQEIEDLNFGPVVVNPVSDIRSQVGDPTITIQLSTVFEDPDGDALTYSIVAGESVSLVGSELTVSFARELSETVTIRATDTGGVSQDMSFSVDVQAEIVNEAPLVVSSLPNVTGAAGDADVTVDVSSVFSDPNGDTLTYSLVGSPASATLVGSTLTISRANAVSETVTVTAADAEGLTNQDSFTVNVSAVPVNQAPVVVNPISDVNGSAGDAAVTVDLTQVFSDPDGDTLAYSVVSGTTASISGSTLTVSRSSAITETVTIRATDPGGLRVDEAFLVSVDPVNQAPVVVNPIPDITGNVGDTSVGLFLNNIFSDPNGDSLTYSVASGTSASITGSALSVNRSNPVNESVTIVATDPEGLSVSTTFNVNISSVQTNQAPVVASPISDITGIAGDSQVSIDLTQVFNDPEGQTLTFTLVSGASASISGTTLSINRSGAVSETVQVRATDPDGASITDEFTVTVAANQPPTVANPISDVSTTEGDPDVLVDLGAVFIDPEGEGLTYSLVSGTSASIDPDGTTVRVSSANAVSENVTVRATDTRGAFVEDTFAVTVASGAPISLGTYTQSPDPSPYASPVELVFTGYSGVTLAVRTLEGDLITTDADDDGRLTIPAEFTYQDIEVQVFDASGATTATLNVALNLGSTATSPTDAGSVSLGATQYVQTDVPVPTSATAPTDAGSVSLGATQYAQTDVPIEGGSAAPADPGSVSLGVTQYVQTDVPVQAGTAPTDAGSLSLSVLYNQEAVPIEDSAPTDAGSVSLGATQHDQTDVPVEAVDTAPSDAGTVSLGATQYTQTDVPTA